MANSKFIKSVIFVIAFVMVTSGGAFLWSRRQASERPVTIASGNGRIEATEIDIATKYQGHIAEIFFHEGDFLEAGQAVARMDTKSQQAQLKQAEASVEQARHARSYAQALVKQRKSELIVTRKDYERSLAAYESNNHAIAIRHQSLVAASMAAGRGWISWSPALENYAL